MNVILDRVHQLTVAQVTSWRPCVGGERLIEWFGGRTEITLRELFQEPIPADYLLWLVLREDFMPADHLHELGCRFAEFAIESGRAQSDRGWIRAGGGWWLVAVRTVAVRTGTVRTGWMSIDWSVAAAWTDLLRLVTDYLEEQA